MTQEQRDWLTSIAEQAKEAQHVFPEMAACEAAEESRFGESRLAKEDNNLFGLKVHWHNVYDSVSLPTKEFLDGSWQVLNQNFEKYATLQECFEDRMKTLTRLAPHFAHYAEALVAKTPQEYVRCVSASWSTDPQRAQKVQAIYDDFKSGSTI